MMPVRMLVYGVLGALFGAASMYVLQLRILSASGADVTSVGLEVLLVEVMSLPSFALFGAVLTALVAPLSLTWYSWWGRALGWLLMGALAALAVPLVAALVAQGGFPTAGEIIWIFTPANKYLLVAGFLAFTFTLGEMLWDAVSLRRVPRLDLDETGGVEYKADELIKSARRERAERYLARRRAERRHARRGPGPRPARELD